MSTLAIRHAKSYANIEGDAAFASRDAEIIPNHLSGHPRAFDLRSILLERGVSTPETPVAVSQFIRTQQTALAAGFRKLITYERLNEMSEGLTPELWLHIKETREVPESYRIRARVVIENPPKEKVFIAHGFLIATICLELGIYQDEPYFTPDFCEVRELPL